MTKEVLDKALDIVLKELELIEYSISFNSEYMAYEVKLAFKDKIKVILIALGKTNNKSAEELAKEIIDEIKEEK